MLINYTVDLYERRDLHMIFHVVRFHVVSEEIDFLGFDSLRDYIMDKSKLYIADSCNVFYTIQQELVDYNV